MGATQNSQLTTDMRENVVKKGKPPSKLELCADRCAEVADYIKEMPEYFSALLPALNVVWKGVWMGLAMWWKVTYIISLHSGASSRAFIVPS